MEQIYEKSLTGWRLRSYVRANESRVEHFDENTNEVTNTHVSLNPALITRLLSAAAFALILTSIAVQSAHDLTGYSSVFLHKAVKFLSVDLELNVPTFFSMLLMLFTASLLALIAFFKRKQKASGVLYWAILSAGFFFMGFDEIVSIHERLIEPMRAVLGEKNLGVFYFAWVVPGILLVLFLALFFLKFWWNLPAKTRIVFLIASVLYIGGAIGVELVGGSHAEIYGKKNLPYILIAAFEESLEMAGVIVFVRGLLEYIAVSYKEVKVHFFGALPATSAVSVDSQNQEVHTSKAILGLGYNYLK
jgi:hypothetical protein